MNGGGDGVLPGERLVRFGAMLFAGAVLAAAAARSTAPGIARVPTLRVDVNESSPAQLALLPGVGEALAERIVRARAVQRFASPEDLARVDGIGPRTVARLRDWVSFGIPGRSAGIQ